VNYLGLTTELSMNYAQIKEQSTDIIIPCFFGIFNGIYQISEKRSFRNKNVDDIELSCYLTDGIGSGLVIHLIFSNRALAKNTTNSYPGGAYFHAYNIRRSSDVFITRSTVCTTIN